MNYKENARRMIVLMLLLTAAFVQPPISAQSLDASDGVTINYLFTIGDEDRVEVSTVVPMHYHNNKSVFLMNYLQEGTTEFENEGDGDMKASIRLGGEMNAVYFINRNNNKIIAHEIIIDEPVNVEENIPVFVWSITGESRKIAEHDCYEATTSFRGRSFSAWFTPDVPLDIGPWKFSGLPGAILQVNDKEGRFNWYCKSIGVLSTENEKLIQAPRNKHVYSFKEFQKLNFEKFIAFINEKFTGGGLSVTSEPNFDSSLERPLK